MLNLSYNACMARRNQINVRFSDEELSLIDELVERGKERGYPDRSKVIRELAGFSPMRTVTIEDRGDIMKRLSAIAASPERRRARPKLEIERRASE